MANFEQVNVTFSGFSELDATIRIDFITTSPAVTYTRTWICKAVRSQAYQYQQGASASDQMGKFVSAATADIENDPIIGPAWNASPYSSVAVAFQAAEYGWTSAHTFLGTTRANASYIREVLPAKNFQLTGYSIAAGSVPCSDIELTIEENDGVSPYTWITPSNASTSLVAQIARQATNQTISVTLEDSETDQATLAGIVIPQLFTSALITSVSVVPNNGGLDATVTAFLSNPDSIFTYEYSVDGVNFSTSNVFLNLTDGDYTLYVTDGYGCLITYLFTVDIENEIVRLDSYEVIPKSNSLRFVKQVIKQYQTLDNTLYHEAYFHGEYKPKYYQKYQSNDPVITTQFRSNYEVITAGLYDCAGELIAALTPVQKSSNLGAQDKRDCTIFNLGDNQTGIFFTTGNIYDPGTLDIIDTFDLHGNVPEWGIVGNTVVMSGVGSFVIKQVTYNDEVKATVLVIDNTWTSGNETEAKIAECTYNRQPYEVYEIAFSPVDLLGYEYFTVVISMTDSLYPAILYNSERIQIVSNFIASVYIEYSDGPYSGIDYSTGIVGKLRVKGLDPYHALTPGGEVTAYKDNLFETVKLKDVATMEGLLFIQEQPRYMVEKLRLAFSHQNIWINGEKWVNEEGMETNGFQHSALRNVSLKLRRKDYEPYATDYIDLDGQEIAGQEIIE